jgi:hypothetical protein
MKTRLTKDVEFATEDGKIMRIPKGTSVEVDRGESDERWKPGEGEDYFFVDGEGDVINTYWTDDSTNHNFLEIGNVFSIVEEAEAHSMRLKAMADKWWPGNGNKYYAWDIWVKKVTMQYMNCYFDVINYWIGNTHPTKEAAEAWGKKYGKYFEVD